MNCFLRSPPPGWGKTPDLPFSPGTRRRGLKNHLCPAERDLTPFQHCSLPTRMIIRFLNLDELPYWTSAPILLPERNDPNLTSPAPFNDRFDHAGLRFQPRCKLVDHVVKSRTMGEDLFLDKSPLCWLFKMVLKNLY